MECPWVVGDGRSCSPRRLRTSLLTLLPRFTATDKAYEVSQKYKEGKYILEKAMTGALPFSRVALTPNY